MANWWDPLPGSGTPLLPPSLLPSGGLTANSPGRGGLPSWASAGGAPRSSASTVGGGMDWSKLALGGISAIAPLFAGGGSSNKALTDAIAAAQKSATDLGTEGKALTAQGTTALGPIMKYLQAIASGDPTALLNATRPERTRVLDQYDTARKTIANTQPRGGGQASAMVNATTRQASDLAAVGSNAQHAATDTAAQLASGLLSAGVNTEHAATAGLINVIGPLLQKAQADKRSIADTFEGIAAVLGPLLFA